MCNIYTVSYTHLDVYKRQALKWMERQSECDHVQLPSVKRLRDMALPKRVTTSKQRRRFSTLLPIPTSLAGVMASVKAALK